MSLPFLQSLAWEKFQQSQGKKTFRLSDDNFEVLAILDSTPVGSYLSCPYGPILKDKSALKTALKTLRKLAKEQNAIFVRIEPQIQFSATEMKNIGAKKVHDIEPAATWALDLTQPQEIIQAGIEKEKMRLWRNGHKKGISFRQSTNPKDVEYLSSLLAQVAKKDGFNPHSTDYLKAQVEQGFASLYLVELDPSVKDPEQKSEKIPIAASMIYDYDGVRYYMHSAADYEHRKLGAGSSILVQMILDAQSAGLKSFDFWGITTSTDKNHPWYGFTQFKKSYGGAEKIYTGTYDLPIKKFKYSLYTLLRSLNKLIRKLR